MTANWWAATWPSIGGGLTAVILIASWRATVLAWLAHYMDGGKPIFGAPADRPTQEQRMTTIYIVMIEDRHTDPQAYPFYA